MASILETVKSHRPKVSDPRNVSSDVSPADLEKKDPPSVESEVDLVNLVTGRFKDSSESRRIHEREWLLATQFERGNQWVEWRASANQLESLVDPNDPYRSYITDNQIRPLCKKLKARATMSKPDASVKPLSGAELDLAAADEARDALTHYDMLFNRQQQTVQWVDSTLTTSTSFLKIIWDAGKEAWTVDSHGAPLRAGIGDIEEIVVPPFEVYPDPTAREWCEVSWLIHAKVRPLSYIQNKYGERGYRVQGDKMRGDNDGAFNHAEQRLDAITGDYAMGSNKTSQKTATVYECWELPSARYPKGRRIPVAGGVLLVDPDKLDWPYKKKDAFPFIPLNFEMKFHGLWSPNAVTDMIPLQRHLNNVLSRIADRVNTDKGVILEPRGAETGLDAYQSRRNWNRVQHNPGFSPQYFMPPPVSEYWFRFAEMLQGQMENIAGVHEVSNGAVPPGITAGNAIELLQQSDTTQMSEFLTNIETAQKQRAEWELALVAQFYDEPRLVAVSALTAPAELAAPIPGGLRLPSPQSWGNQSGHLSGRDGEGLRPPSPQSWGEPGWRYRATANASDGARRSSDGTTTDGTAVSGRGTDGAYPEFAGYSGDGGAGV